MSANEFDQAVRDKYDELDFPFKKENWESLRHEMDFNEVVYQKKWPTKSIAIAAAFFIFCSVWGTVLYNYMNKETEMATTKMDETKEKKIVDQLLGDEIEARNNPNSISALSKNFVKANAYTKYLKRPLVNPTAKLVKPTYASPALAAAIVQKEIQSKISQTSEMTPSFPNASEANMVETKPDLLAAKHAFLSNDRFKDYPVTLNANVSKPALQLGVVGGIGYAGQNINGYLVGLNTSSRLGKKWFLDGTLALGSSRESFDVHHVQIAQPNALASKSPTEASTTFNGNIYYVSFSPGIGVNISKRISVTAGGDVQRIFRNTVESETPIYTNSNSGDKTSVALGGPISISDWDAGLKSKISYQVAPQLNLSLQYRYGLVNLLSGQNDLKLKRSYGLFTLQYNLKKQELKENSDKVK